MVDSLKDKYLIFKAKHGSKAVIAEIFDRYFQKIYRFVYFRLSSREDAEDLAADVFLQFQGHIQRGGEIRSLGGLLYQIARNKIIDFYRMKKVEQIPIYHLETGEESINNLSKLILNDENGLKKIELTMDMQVVFQALDSLKSEYREVILLHYINEMSVREISEALSKTENNIRVMLFRALTSLREAINFKKPDTGPGEGGGIYKLELNGQQKLNQNFKESNTS